MNKHVRYFGAVLLFLLAALLVIAAVPASVLARFRNRTARERKAAVAAFAGIPASFGQDFDPEIAAAAETLRAYGFPFVSSGFSNHFEPPTAGELAAIRAWREGHPDAVALFDRVSSCPSNAPAALPEPGGRDRVAAQCFWTWYHLPFFERGFLEEAAARGDRAAAEEFDRRLRNLDRRTADLVFLGQSEILRLGTFSQTLPIFSDAYLDELDRDAGERLAGVGATIAARLATILALETDDPPTNVPAHPEGTFFRRFADRIEDEMARANQYRFYANAPAALARLDDVRLHPRPVMKVHLGLVYGDFEAGMVREWPSRHTLFRTGGATLTEYAVRKAGKLHNAFCFERIAIAIERFRRRTGRLPERLEDLPDALPGCLPTGQPPAYRTGTFRVAGFRRPESGEEAERRSRAFEEETDREFLDPDFKRTPAPGFRVRGYILSIRYPTPLDPGLQLGHVDEEDEDCAGCFLWGTVVPDDDPELVVEKPFGPAEEESWPPGEM